MTSFVDAFCMHEFGEARLQHEFGDAFDCWLPDCPEVTVGCCTMARGQWQIWARPGFTREECFAGSAGFGTGVAWLEGPECADPYIPPLPPVPGATTGACESKYTQTKYGQHGCVGEVEEGPIEFNRCNERGSGDCNADPEGCFDFVEEVSPGVFREISYLITDSSVRFHGLGSICGGICCHGPMADRNCVGGSGWDEERCANLDGDWHPYRDCAGPQANPTDPRVNCDYLFAFCDRETARCVNRDYWDGTVNEWTIALSNPEINCGTVDDTELCPQSCCLGCGRCVDGVLPAVCRDVLGGTPGDAPLCENAANCPDEPL